MRRDYSGAAGIAQITASIPATFTDPQTIQCDDLTNWPTGDTGPFFVVVDRDNGDSEEKILCESRSGNVLTVYYDPSTSTSGRGADGTAIKAHSNNASIEHVFTAIDADEANAHVNSSSGVHGISGSVVGTTDTQTLTNKTLSAPVISGTVSNVTLSNPTISNPTITGGSATAFPPIGTIVSYVGDTAPTGWLLCRGQQVSSATYPTLSTLIGSKFNSGQTPSAGNFFLPNLQGRVPVGMDSTQSEFDLIGDSGGDKASTAPHTHDIDHNHAAFNAQSGNASQDHTHGLGNHTHGGTTNFAGDHGHWSNTYDRTAYGSGNLVAKAYQLNSGATSVNGSHQHTFSTGGPSTNTSDGQSQNHTHTTTIDVPALGTTASGASSAAAASGNLQPYLTVNYIIKAL